jgi:uncharacterized protein (TIGR03083 family)
MEQLIPIPTLHLFKVLDDLLIELLTSLSPDDWNKPTPAKLWTVKDVAGHLLDGNVRDIAALDNYAPPVSAQINSYQDLVNYLNELNAVWVNAMKRMSPQLLLQLLKTTGPKFIEYMHTLDPFKPAKYSVAWAGEEQSLNWFHIAREYTEKWHHQQQIREAVNKKSALMTRELFYPCIATFMCALPHAYRNIPAQTGTTISFTISGEAGGAWVLQKDDNGWQLQNNISVADPAAYITIPPDIAWKLFTKAILPATAIESSTIKGNNNLATGIFNMVAVMA